MKKTLTTLFLITSTVMATGCGAENTNVNASPSSDQKIGKEQSFENKKYVIYIDEGSISKDVSTLGGDYDKYYDKYIKYIAPNGKPITIVAASQVTNEQVLKAYNILSFYLTNTAKYDKTAVANSMAENGAVLVMPNGSDGDGKTPEDALLGQPLYQMETPTAGSKWYMDNDYSHRDASYEEIFHLVHGEGIGTTTRPAAESELAQKIKSGMDKALPQNKADWGQKGLWGLNSLDWLKELEAEGSLENEYIVSGIDSYYGLWEAYTENDKGMWGIYIPKNRSQVQEKDPAAYEVITDFVGPELSYMERISPDFDGTFKLYLDQNETYTFKSQYNQNARLTGAKNSNLEGNNLDNILLGNKGNNIIDGKDGNDVVQLSSKSTEYVLTRDGEDILIKDKKSRDGEDTLKNIEILRFTDKDIPVDEIS
ncbi:hypothetical protein [Rothia sp. P5766]|uniref:hypothetical protein n=1 Tax=Rothia sp. P5766 TaxID=3402656 RepID=UPI003AE7EF92